MICIMAGVMILLHSLIKALFPPLCVHCSTEGSWLCSEASRLITCEKILIDPITIPGIDHVFTRGSYDCQPLAQFIQKLKYHYWTGVAEVIDEIIAPLHRFVPITKNTIIVPVPLHRRRLLERGFNQSQFICRSLSRLTARPVLPLLRRARYTTPQATLNAGERATNILGAFGYNRKQHWPASVLLVDDVITTGSTIAACASVLRQHNVQQITAVALAKG